MLPSGNIFRSIVTMRFYRFLYDLNNVTRWIESFGLEIYYKRHNLETLHTFRNCQIVLMNYRAFAKNDIDVTFMLQFYKTLSDFHKTIVSFDKIKLYHQIKCDTKSE